MFSVLLRCNRNATGMCPRRVRAAAACRMNLLHLQQQARNKHRDSPFSTQEHVALYIIPTYVERQQDEFQSVVEFLTT